MAKTARSNPLVDAAAADSAETKRKAKTSPKPRTARWTDEEVKRLRAFVPDGAPSGTWSFIASHFEGRNAKSCRQKYFQIADQNKKGQNWSVEEDHILISLQGREGNKWKLISESIEGRSENDVKNRWYSLKRTENRKRAKDNGSNAKAATRKKPARASSSFNAIDALDASRLFDMPPLPDAAPSGALESDPSSMMSIMDAGAVSSLVAMKTGQTPVRHATTSHPLANEAKFFGVTDWNKENIAPTTFDTSSHTQRSFMGHIPTRKFIYPPPPVYKKSADGIVSEVAQYESKCSPPVIVPNSLRNIKAHEIFSPSYGLTGQATTPSSGIPLDSLPLCDSIPLKRTPMIADQSCHFIGQCSTIMHSPLVSKKKSTPNAFTPLPFTNIPDTTGDPGLFFQTAGMLQSSNSKHTMHYNLPLYSPMTKSTPSGATAV